MSTKYIAFSTTGAGLSASSLAFAHGSGSAGTNLYHYLSSPDHLITFGALAMVAVALMVRALRRSKVVVQQDKR